jgi:hypothetical protein
MPYSTVLFKSGGYTGSPGYTKLKFMGALDTAGANAAAAAGRTFLAATSTNMPSSVSYTCDPTCQTFSDDGTLTGEVAITSVPATINGSGAATFPGGAGAVVYWLTNALNGGHKVKGRTYLVPLSTAAFAADGTLAATLISNLTTAANNLVAGTPNLAVNSRSNGQPGRGNQTNVVVSALVKDRSAFLRTRRT